MEPTTQASTAAASLISSGRDFDVVTLREGIAVPATWATAAEEFTVQLEQALGADEPTLVGVVGRNIIG
jgi:hypothetical protein